MPDWLNSKYYLYEVEVFSRLKNQIVTNLVTDPYSLGLAPNSLKSLVVDLDSPLSQAGLVGLDFQTGPGESNRHRSL